MKIAVIGAGISGMGCAWAISRDNEVVLFEKNAAVGGHARTIDINVEENNKTIPVDTGFIVFNQPNYPNLVSLLNFLKVPVSKSRMSFGVSLGGGRFEYGTNGLKGFLGQPTNLLRPSFWRMFFDILKFNRSARVTASEGQTLGQLLDQMNMSQAFRLSYLLPMAASIWSTPAEKMLQYPAESLLRFFENHGLLTLFRQPQWYTIDGGSREYVCRLMNDYQGELVTNADIHRVTRLNDERIEIGFADGSLERFDKVIFACHVDQALDMLTDLDDAETDVLQHFRFQTNQIVTHKDERFMHKRKVCWSSWAYLDSAETSLVSLSYWMNNLQPLRTNETVLVTMNPGFEPKMEDLHDQWSTEHPLFDQSAIDAQEQLKSIQGRRNTYFCGAWAGYGFHEDGLRSGLDVAESLGAQIPWRAQPC